MLDYQVLSESTERRGPDGDAGCSSSSPTASSSTATSTRAGRPGLQIVGIDLEAFALLRALAEPHDPLPAPSAALLVAVSVGHDRSTFAVSDGRVCEFTRVLEWGGWSLNVAIARALDTLAHRSRADQAGALVRRLDRVLRDGFTEEQLAAAHEAARRQLQTFARELVSSLQFYQNQPGSLGIGEIVVTGGTAHLPGLGGELAALIGVPVRVGDPFDARRRSRRRLGEQRADRLARRRDRPRDRGLDARSQPSPTRRQPRRLRGQPRCRLRRCRRRRARHCRARAADDRRRRRLSDEAGRARLPERSARGASLRPVEASTRDDRRDARSADRIRAIAALSAALRAGSPGIVSCASSRSCCPTTSG